MNSINSISEALSCKRAMNSYKATIKKHLKQADLKSLCVDDIYVLAAINNGIHAIRDICMHLNTERHYVSKFCQRLLKTGLIEKTASDDDLRNHFFHITDTGRNLLQKLS